MSNQFVLWCLVILPWFSFFFLSKQDIKRYMPAAIFGSFLTLTAEQLGSSFHWWIIKETIFPLHSVQGYYYGIFPVSIIWIFKYTSRQFWLYMATNTIINSFASFLFWPWTSRRGIIELIISSSQHILIPLSIAVAIYVYQKWQEDVSVANRE